MSMLWNSELQDSNFLLLNVYISIWHFFFVNWVVYYFGMVILLLFLQTLDIQHTLDQLAGAAEYNDCISAER